MNIRSVTTCVTTIALFFFYATTFYTTTVLAGDDPNIKGTQRSDIQAAMQQHIQQNRIGDSYVIFDGQAGGLKRLSLQKLHAGIVKKGDFYVSCADFNDAKGELYDLDFLVSPDGNGGYKVIQSLVHAVAGKKRAYHVEG